MDDKVINDILLKMSYDPSKTLNENLNEQMGQKTWLTPKGMSYQQNLDAQGLTNKQINNLKKWLTDPHILLPLGALVLTVASGGVASPLLAATLAGGSLALEIGDVALYWKEGDYESAGIGAIFALIPGAQLAKKLGLNFVGDMTESQIKTFLKKVKNGLDLTEKEKKLLQSLNDNKSALRVMTSRQAAKALTAQYLEKYTKRKLLAAVLQLQRLGIRLNRITWRITAGGVGLITLAQAGKILGLKAAESLGAQLPEKYVQLPEEEKNKVKQEINSKLESQSQQLREDVYKTTEMVLETMNEEKIKQYTDAVNKSQESYLDALDF